MPHPSSQGAAEAPLTPQGLALGLRTALDTSTPAPLPDRDLLAWGRTLGLEADLRRALDPHWTPRHAPRSGEPLREAPLTPRQAHAALHRLVSTHPERFREIEEGVRHLQRHFLKAQAQHLEDCGTTWRGHIVRVFWRDRRGRERLRRQVGLHRCKAAWCPTCGRSRQARIVADVEKLLVLAEDWGFHAGHARLLTLTLPNGQDIAALREQAHHAFKRLQNTRWWNRHAFGFVRGSEVVTGDDGNWNFHLHFLVLFWHPRMDYRDLSDHWTAALGGKRPNGRNYTVDVQSLEAQAWRRKDGQEGRLARRNLLRAARYIAKYLCKDGEARKLQAGPGGLPHLLLATKGLRRSAFGGGCALLRRSARLLMPPHLHAAEEALAGHPLHQGRPPLRIEILDPATGEITPANPLPLDPDRDRALRAWGEALETNPEPKAGWTLPGRVVGIPCGPRGRYRRLGPMPLASRAPTVKAFEAWQKDPSRPSPLTGLRALVAGGAWTLERWQRTCRRTGNLRPEAAVLPARRFAWRPLQTALRAAMDLDPWAAPRARAAQAYVRPPQQPPAPHPGPDSGPNSALVQS